MINGKNYDWEDISTTFPHGELINFTDIEYSDEKEVEATYGKGSNPQAYGTGNYSAGGKVTVKKEEHDRIVDYARKLGKPLYKMPPFPIVVSYANEDRPTKTDVLRQCKINKISHSSSQGDKELKVDYEIKILGGIVRDGVEPN